MSWASPRDGRQAAVSADVGPGGRGAGRRRVRTLLSLASLVAAAALIVWGMPAVSGLRWSQILAELSGLRFWQLVILTALWLAGLWAYSFVLTASLPGLRNWQGFTLNTVGSAVSNLLPFGGAAGVAVLYALTAGWGFTRRAVLGSRHRDLEPPRSTRAARRRRPAAGRWRPHPGPPDHRRRADHISRPHCSCDRDNAHAALGRCR